MANYVVSDGNLSAVADAIRQKVGTSAQLAFPAGFVSAVEAIPTGGGGGVSPSDVNFYDFDGSVVASYTAAEFAALSAMPENPSHDGLTAQGWNWSFEKAQAYVAKYGKLNVGQMYITSDGKTRIYIRLEEGRLAPYLGIAVNGSVDVDWGDGSPHDTVTGTSTSTVINTQHTYAQAGDYVIALTVTGSMSFVGNTTCGSKVLWKNETTRNLNLVYQNSVQKVEIGQGVTSIEFCAFSHCYSLASITIPDSVTSLGVSVFDGCYSLASITIPDGVTKIDGSTFGYCYSLASISIPDSVTSTGTYVFSSCSSLASISIQDGVTSIAPNIFSSCYSLAPITIPEGVTSIGASAFYYCQSLASITIPDSVTSIAREAFSNCAGLAFIKFERTTPATVASGNAFSGIPSDCVIYVPAGSLSAYTSATNYPSSSTYTYVEY